MARSAGGVAPASEKPDRRTAGEPGSVRRGGIAVRMCARPCSTFRRCLGHENAVGEVGHGLAQTARHPASRPAAIPDRGKGGAERNVHVRGMSTPARRNGPDSGSRLNGRVWLRTSNTGASSPSTSRIRAARWVSLPVGSATTTRMSARASRPKRADRLVSSPSTSTSWERSRNSSSSHSRDDIEATGGGGVLQR